MPTPASMAWEALVARFDALGDAAQALLDRRAPPAGGEDGADAADLDALAALLAERDALLAALAASLPAAGAADPRLRPALERSAARTSDLLEAVAARTDMLRDELRALQRGSDVDQAYRRVAPVAARRVIDARR
jgi:hypothetical protein